jgi:hypothetical protein
MGRKSKENTMKEPKQFTEKSGGCQCGAVRYSFTGSFGPAGICHCRMCQKAFGSWGAALVSVPFERFTWTRGEPSVFRSSAIVARGFCSACGTQLYMREDGDSNIELAIGALDQPNDITELVQQSGVESKLHWFNALAHLPEETSDASRTPEDMQNLASFQHPDHDTENWPLKPRQP